MRPELDRGRAAAYTDDVMSAVAARKPRGISDSWKLLDNRRGMLSLVLVVPGDERDARRSSSTVMPPMRSEGIEEGRGDSLSAAVTRSISIAGGAGEVVELDAAGKGSNDVVRPILATTGARAVACRVWASYGKCATKS